MAPTIVAEDRLTSGHRLSHPPPGDEVLISGISGYFPDSDSVVHLQENLFNKVDLVTAEPRRWSLKHPEIPQRGGKINNLNKFDASFFGVDYKEAHTMDPMGRILLEKTYEAIVEAGMNPNELRGTKTGVFVGACFSESEKPLVKTLIGSGLTGCSRAMLANRISYWLGVTGPSYTVDTACSSSMYALEHAFRAIRNGHCDSAIVGGSNLCLNPYVSLQFSRLGALSPDGRCKSFDKSANGYVRSEAIVVVFLQKAKDSRRAFMQLYYAKTNCDGYKEQGITYPAGQIQKLLLREFYEECSIPPHILEFVEAHGTGTRVGDPEELQAIDEIFCTGRSEPLKIGSIKSNLGHSEPASGLCSIAKMCIAYSTGSIPPNLNYANPCEGVAALTDGRLEVVIDKTPWRRGMSGVNGFGFGGANAHVLLKKFARDKVNKGIPQDDLPRLVCVSGRTKSAVARILDDLESRTVDVELVRLLHSIHDKEIQGHTVRGYSLLGSTPVKSVSLSRDVQNFSGVRRPVWFVYSGMGSQWAGMAAELMRIPVFAAAIHKCHKALEPLGINLIAIITEQDFKIHNILKSFIGIAAVQIGLTDVLRTVGIQPDHVTGQDIGKLGCAYACGILTAEETIRSAFSRGIDCTRSPLVEGSLPSVNIDFKQSPVLFKENFDKIQHNAITIEMAPHGVLQTTIRKPFNDAINIALMERNNKDSVQVLFNTLGQLYEAGLNPHLANIYPHVPFPVSQETPMFAHLVEWEHSDDWCVTWYRMQSKKNEGERTVKISIKDQCYDYLAGHIIDGRVLYPGIGYLVLVWETFGMMMGILYTELSVVFENIRFLRATNISEDACLEFVITIHKGNGNFEIVENGSSVVTGKIYAEENAGQQSYRVLPLSPEVADPNIKHLTTKDFYKELKLRGYQHSGLFRGVLECNVQGTRGRVSWVNNWVTFMDSMLQIKVIGDDARHLFLPVRIDKLSIDVNRHYSITSKMNPSSINNSIEVRVYPEADIVRSGGVEVRGVYKMPITRRLPLGVPVLEKNEFVANLELRKLEIEDVLRVFVQLILENIQTYKVKSAELADEEYKKNGYRPVLGIVEDILGDLPLVRAELLLISEDHLKISDNITVFSNLRGETDIVVFIGANLLKRPDVLQQAEPTLRDKSFLISRENQRPDPQQFCDRYDIVCVHHTGLEYLVLFRKRVGIRPTTFVKIVTSDESFEWVNQIKQDMRDGQKLVLYNQDEYINGLLGLVNCLRKEPSGEVVCGLLIADPSAPAFNPDLEFYKNQLDKDLAINVYQNGQWGTYRHLLLGDLETVAANHAYVNTLRIGDLSSLRWLQGPLKEDHVFKDAEKILVHVYCTALNFRDVMTATGRVTVDAVARGRLAQECVQGFEVVGKTPNGTRVMGMVKSCGMANLVSGMKSLLWPIPDEWTFEEAASVPVAYGTAYYAMVIKGRMQRGESILIHAGSGGVGQAAINVALHYGCKVFTTVGTDEKRAFIKKLFPQLKDSHIGNSRNTSFEDMIRRETNGKGVDLVLNSLSDDKLQASVRCLGRLGRFLEIGKFDISKNTLIGMHFFNTEISFHGIMLDYIFEKEFNYKEKHMLNNLLMTGIGSSAVRPLTYCTFKKDEIEAAYRYMASGQHIGKIIIKIRNDETSGSIEPTTMPIAAMPRYMCHEDRVYIVVGGLGGFGLELADWLILRGARKVMLTSRRGIVNGYQSYRIQAWASYGADVLISTEDITTESGCEEMLRAANAMGPVDAIFNLAVILKDSVFQNQTPETFKISYGPKATATIHLDKFSKKLCPELRDFVVFSSVSCGRGNAGQTNYGFSNSVMERICESRQKLGFPALAIQWGAVGDVGLVADMQDEETQLEIGGTLQQKISSCLLVLDRFMMQDAAIVSSIVVAEKKASGFGAVTIMDAVAQIMGIKDMTSISQQVSLAELGMDSMMAVEIKQTLEREFEIFLTAQDIRTLTFSKLVDLNEKREATSMTPNHLVKNVEIAAGLKIFMRNFGDENLVSKPLVYVPTLVSDGIESEEAIHVMDRVMFMLPGLEGCAAALEPLCRRLKIKVCVLQLGIEHRNEGLEAMVSRLHQSVTSRLAPGAVFWLLGYSFGSLLALELAARLETEGINGTVFCLDGAPDFLQAMVTSTMNFDNDFQLQNNLLCNTIDVIAPNNGVTQDLMEKLNGIDSYEERVELALKVAPLKMRNTYSDMFIVATASVCYDRLKAILIYNPLNAKKIKSPIILIRPKVEPVNLDIGKNYGLDKLTESTVTVHYVEGNHVSIVDNEDVANIINQVLSVNNQNDHEKKR